MESSDYERQTSRFEIGEVYSAVVILGFFSAVFNTHTPLYISLLIFPKDFITKSIQTTKSVDRFVWKYVQFLRCTYSSIVNPNGSTVLKLSWTHANHEYGTSPTLFVRKKQVKNIFFILRKIYFLFYFNVLWIL